MAAPEQRFPQDALDDLSAEVRWRLAHRNGCSQLSLAGELDLAAVAELHRAAAGLDANGGGATAVVDPTRVSFVGPPGPHADLTGPRWSE